MTFIVGEDCIKCKYTDCVDPCPVDCFHEGPNTLVIDPDECIDCALCEPVCPTKAIFDEPDIPEDQAHFLELNAELSLIWPVITDQKDPLPDADKWNPSPEDDLDEWHRKEEWNGIKNKLDLLER